MSAPEAPRDPEELEAAGAPASAEIAAATSMGAVHLTVADLERAVDAAFPSRSRSKLAHSTRLLNATDNGAVVTAISRA